MDKNTYLAQKQIPKKPITGFRVKVGHVVYYENAKASLCFDYAHTHGLVNYKVEPVR